MVRPVVQAIAVLCLLLSANAFSSENATGCIRESLSSKIRPGSAAHWDEIEDIYHDALVETFQDDQRALMREADERGDEHWKRLASFGFDYKTGQVPTLKQINDVYNQAIDAHIAAGHIQGGDAFRPTFPFSKELEDGSVEWRFIRYGDTIPEGFKLYSRQYLPTQVYYMMLNEGYFPLGKASVIDWAGELVVEHDLAHLTGFMDYPELMPAIKKAANQNFLDHVEAPGALRTPHARRFYHLSELAYSVPEKARTEIVNTLSLPTPKGNVLKVEEVSPSVDSMNAAEVQARAELLLKNYWGWIKNYSGTSRDIHMRLEDRFIVNDTIYRDYDALREWQKSGFSPKKLEKAKRSVALLQTNLYNFSFVGIKDWVDAVQNPEHFQSSPLYRAICASGSWVKGDRVYKDFCH